MLVFVWGYIYWFAYCMSKIYWFAYWFFLRGGIFLVQVARDQNKNKNLWNDLERTGKNWKDHLRFQNDDSF